MDKKVTVIGAGLGGLAAAIRLAALGMKVTVYEKNSRPGGKMNEEKWSGFRFDTGPSLLTMPEVIEDLFNVYNRKTSDYINLVKIDPTCRYFFADGTTIDTYSDLNKMLKILENESPNQMKTYQNFLTYVNRLYNDAAEMFLFTPIHEFRILYEKLTAKKLIQFGRIDAFSTVHTRLTKFFSDPRLIQIFDRFATYNGSNPFQAPATLNIIAHVELNQGGYYIQGGMYRLVESMLKISENMGIVIHYDSEIQEILHDQNDCKGVRVNHEKIESDYVVCNADVVYTYNHLINGFDKRRKKLNKLEPSLSGIVFLWGIKGKFQQLSHHNIFFSGDYKLEFRELFQNKSAPTDPTVYISITSHQDQDHAPKGYENWFVLVNMPYLSDQQDWTEIVPRIRQAIMDKLSQKGIEISGLIDQEKVLTPKDLESLYKANRGSIYGISSNKQLSAFLRPPNRSRELKNMYFVGGSTHPGGGIPLVLLSAKHVSEIISRREKN
jgi:phytoene desaturase